MTPLPPAAARVDTRPPQYQELKSRVHQGLLNRLNLERLTRWARPRRSRDPRLIIGMLDARATRRRSACSERQSLITDVLNELFGLGPLEELLADPAISGHPREPLRPGLRRARTASSSRWTSSFKDDAPPDADHRAHRQLGRPPHRRVEPDGGRPAARTARASTPSFRRSRSTARSLSIRRFRTDRLGAQDLVERDSLTQPMLDFFRAAVGCRTNVIVSGGTGAGKTTLLNVLSELHLGQGAHRHDRGRGRA